MAQLPVLNLGLALSGFILPSSLPIPLLRIAPLVSSAIALQWAVDNHQFLSSWLAKTYRDQADRLLSDWFRIYASKAVRVLLSAFPWTLGSGFTNLYSLRGSSWSTGPIPWYGAGTFFALAHMFFAPKALRLLKAIGDGEPGGKPTVSLKEWLQMHVVRALVTDLPAIMCFCTAVVRAAQWTA